MEEALEGSRDLGDLGAREMGDVGIGFVEEGEEVRV